MSPRSLSSALPWHGRLETRVAAGIALLVAGSLAIELAAATRTVTARSLERASLDLDAARLAFDRLADDRAEFAAAQSALVTALPIFRAHLTDQRLVDDAATLTAMADEYRRQLKADFCLITDSRGTWIARSGFPARSDASAPAGSLGPAIDAIETALAGRPARAMTGIFGRFYLIVSEPARFADEILGTLSVGYAFDDRIARRLADETHCEINVSAGGRLYASSLGTRDREALARLLASDERRFARGAPDGVRGVGGARYVVGAFPLNLPGADAGPIAADARLILLENWFPAEQFIGQVRRRMVATGVVVFVVAVAAGVLLSRSLSRPLADLADAAGDIADGNWSRQLSVRGGAEAALMARAFNEMTARLRQMYEEVRRRDAALRQAQKLEAVGRLAAGVAHDFNNLLAVISGFGSLLLQGFRDGDPGKTDTEAILEATDSATALTRQLLAFSRKQPVAPRVLELDRMVQRMEPMFRRLVSEDVELSTVFESPLGRVYADATQMEQVLINLVVNARDAMPKGGRLRIELANVEQSGRYVSLLVADTGCGMSEETMSRIFEPFFTTKEEGRGTGLGLATVYGIVEQAGGTIEVQSQLGRGTAFHIYLPRYDAQPESPEPREATAAEVPPDPVAA